MGRAKLSTRQMRRLNIQDELATLHCSDLAKPVIVDLGTEYGHTGKRMRKLFPQAWIIGVEIHSETLEGCAEDCGEAVYDELVNADAVAWLKGHEPVDIIVAAELIEHLYKPAGFDLLHLIKEKTKRLAILTSPIGFAAQGHLFGNPHQEHISGWEPKEFSDVGYGIWRTETSINLGVYVLSKEAA